jgi:hypothetical protein
VFTLGELGKAVVGSLPVEQRSDHLRVECRASLGDSSYGPVVPGERDHLRVPDRHPSDVLDGDCLLVVGQHIGRCPTQAPQCHVQGGEHARHRLVPDRQHHPEPRPRQPGTKQRRPHPVDERAVPEVVLQPHPRLGHPRPVHPDPTQPVVPAHRGDRTTGGPLRTRIAEREQLLVRLVGADLPRRVLHPLLDLGQILIDQLRTSRSNTRAPAGVAGCDMRSHRVVGTPRQLGGVSKRPGQVKRF